MQLSHSYPDSSPPLCYTWNMLRAHETGPAVCNTQNKELDILKITKICYVNNPSTVKLHY